MVLFQIIKNNIIKDYILLHEKNRFLFSPELLILADIFHFLDVKLSEKLAVLLYTVKSTAITMEQWFK